MDWTGGLDEWIQGFLSYCFFVFFSSGVNTYLYYCGDVMWKMG